MKTSKISTKALGLGLALCLVVGLYNCKPKETEPEIPDFEEGYKDVKPLTPVTPSTPAAVTTTPAKVEVSAATSAAAAGLASGTVTVAVTSTANDMAKAISPEKAASLVASFTPSVIASLSSGGALPASLKAEVDALMANPALAAYLPKVTLPTVNGTPVSLFVEKNTVNNTETLPLSYPAFTIAGTSSECTDAAAAAYNAAKKILDDSKAANDKVINDTYNTAAALVSSTSCKATADATLAANLALAKATYDAGIAGINQMSAALGVATTDLLKVFAASTYATSVGIFNLVADASKKACDTEATAKVNALKAVQVKDLATSKSTYDTALAPLKTKVEADQKLCHDQGQGGN